MEQRPIVHSSIPQQRVVESNQVRVLESNNPPTRVSTGNSGIGFSYQGSNSPVKTSYVNPPSRGTIPGSYNQGEVIRTSEVVRTSHVVPAQSTAVESTYVANPNSRFSLEKIDEQL